MKLEPNKNSNPKIIVINPGPLDLDSDELRGA